MENREPAEKLSCSWPFALVLQNTVLRDMHGLQKWKQLHQNLSGDYLSAFCVSPAASQRRLGRKAKRGRFLGKVHYWRMTVFPAAVWFGAFRALETQSSFSRLVCAHTCRPAFNVESHHSTKQWRTQEKPSLKEKVLSEWDIPESRILFLISDWKALMNYPVSNGKHCDLCEEVLTEPLEEEEFILQVQFSDENVHLTDLTQENYVGN